MYSLTLKCNLIPPMFMAGADNKTPELRPSEFKGMMRWWWRAIKAEDNIEKLRKEEAQIFGGTGEKEGKSKIKIVVTLDKPINGNDISTEIKNYEGIKYLYYSTFSLRARGEPIIRAFYSPNTTFKLKIKFI